MNRDDDTPATEGSEDEQPDSKRFRTAPTTPSRQTSIVGQTTKPRISPRNLAKKDYKTLEDPYINSEAYDADGNEVFEQSASEALTSESEEEYGKAEDMIKVESEAAVVV